MRKLLRNISLSPVWPALLSAFGAPGIGQLVNRDYIRGLLLLTVSVGGFFWFSSIMTEQISNFIHTAPDTWMQNPAALRTALSQVVAQNPDMFITFYALMIITWVFGVVDAYLSAKKIRRNINSKHDEDPHPVS